MFARIIIAVVAGFGVLVGLTVLAVVAYDLEALKRGLVTVSAETIALAYAYPILPAAVGLLVGFTVGCLFGHLFFGQVKPL